MCVDVEWIIGGRALGTYPMDMKKRMMPLLQIVSDIMILIRFLLVMMPYKPSKKRSMPMFMPLIMRMLPPDK